MRTGEHDREDATPMGNPRDDRALRRVLEPQVEAAAGDLPAGSLHAWGAGGNGPSLEGRTAGAPGGAVHRDRGADRGVDRDRDARGPLAEPRRGRLPHRDRQGQEGGDRLTIAVPVKGRLRDPSVRLLVDAGLEPEQPGERALAFPCRNAPVDVLLVRAADIPEYVQDGVVDCGITGQDLVRERGARVEELLPLGFGSCRLDAAVPEESTFERIEDLAGASVATVYPHLTRELMPVDVVEARAHRYLMLDAPEARL